MVGFSALTNLELSRLLASGDDVALHPIRKRFALLTGQAFLYFLEAIISSWTFRGTTA